MCDIRWRRLLFILPIFWLSACVSTPTAPSANQYGFTITPPEDQEPKVNHQLLRMQIPLDQTINPTIDLFAIYNLPEHPAQKRLQQLLGVLFKQSGLKLLNHEQVSQQNSSSLYRFDAMHGKQPLSGYLHTKQTGNRLYLMMALATKSQWKSHGSSLMRTLNSLKIDVPQPTDKEQLYFPEERLSLLPLGVVDPAKRFVPLLVFYPPKPADVVDGSQLLLQGMQMPAGYLDWWRTNPTELRDALSKNLRSGLKRQATSQGLQILGDIQVQPKDPQSFTLSYQERSRQGDFHIYSKVLISHFHLYMASARIPNRMWEQDSSMLQNSVDSLATR